MTSPAERLRAWLATAAVEDQHFDIKQDLDLSTPSRRKELLKDLIGMGNGGGGAVAFGVGFVNLIWPRRDGLIWPHR